MSDKGRCGDCGRVSFLLDCEWRENSYDEELLDVEHKCPHCDKGYIEEYIASTRIEFIMYQIRHEIATVKLKLYKHGWIIRRWLDDAFHPGRQTTQRETIKNLIRSTDAMQYEVYRANEHIKHLNERLEKDVLSAVQMLARNTNVSVGTIRVPAEVPMYISEIHSDNPVPIPRIKTMELEERVVTTKTPIMNCYELNKIHIRSKESYAMYCRVVADALSDVLTPFVMKEIFEDMTNERNS